MKSAFLGSESRTLVLPKALHPGDSNVRRLRPIDLKEITGNDIHCHSLPVSGELAFQVVKTRLIISQEIGRM